MIVILILIVIVLGINLLVVWLRINTGKRIASKSKVFEHKNSSAKLKVLFVGDSTAIGAGAKYPEDSLAGRFFKDHPDSEIINLGANGLRTEKIIQILREQKGKYDVVVVQVGGNDILGFVDTQELSKSILEVLILANELSNKVILLTSGNIGSAPFFPKPLGYFYSKKTLEVRKLFMDSAKQYNTTYIDLYEERDKDEFLRDPKKYFAKDMLHPSSEGYAIWYKKFRKTLEEEKIKL